MRERNGEKQTYPFFWLDELLEQVHRRCQTLFPDVIPPENSAMDAAPNLLDNILCALSADPLGIVLKLACDVKLIVGKRFRKVCKALEPFVSNPWKSDISRDTIRSIAGRALRIYLPVAFG